MKITIGRLVLISIFLFTMFLHNIFAAPTPSEPALEPGHYLYLPNANVLKPRQYVLSFRELALGIDNRLHIFFSPFSTIGKLFFGVKYGKTSGTALAAGLTHGPVVASHDRWGHDYFWDESGMGIGAFAAKTLARRKTISGNIQFNEDYLSLGAGLAGINALGEVTDIMYEFQISATRGFGADTYLNFFPEAGAALRYTFPVLKPLKLDFGIGIGERLDYRESRPTDQWQHDLDYGPYIDISYSSNF